VTSRFATIDKKLSERKILTLDIERLPGLARVWDQRTTFIPVRQWTRLPQLLSVSAKWYGRREIMFRAAWDDPEQMVRDVWSWIDEADILYTFNGDRFDIPHLRGSFLTAGLLPPSSYKSVDLFKVARKFGFESKSLVHLCQRLGLPGKTGHYDAELAEAAMAGDVKAQNTMRRYNNGDVKITEMCADAMRPWISGHPHVHTSSGDELHCPNCGSDQYERNGTQTAVVLEYAEYRCQGCGTPFRAGHVRRVARTRGVRT
jgi:DNA-directed RNA polymerase subunit RPC12/RpoP